MWTLPHTIFSELFQVRQWLLKLDASLPGKLGKLGEWLYHAEKLMRKKEEVTDNYDQMATYYADLAKEHRVRTRNFMFYKH